MYDANGFGGAGGCVLVVELVLVLVMEFWDGYWVLGLVMVMGDGDGDGNGDG